MKHHLLFLPFVLMTLGCGKSGSSCCQCLIDNDCWDSQSCPDDPMGSCEYVRGDGDVPSYADESLDVCYASDSACEEDNCSDKCEELD